MHQKVIYLLLTKTGNTYNVYNNKCYSKLINARRALRMLKKYSPREWEMREINLV